MQGPDDWELFLEAPAEAAEPSLEKQYYMVLTLSGFGVLAVVALKSGSKCLQDEGEIVYWFDRLVELGIGTEKEQNMLRKKTWTVLLYTVLCTCSMHASSAASQRASICHPIFVCLML
jgi:hypothetical protein